MRVRVALVALMAAGVLVAGCGDDDEDTTTTTTTSEGTTGASGASGEQGAEAGGGTLPDDFAQQMNDICAEGNQEIDSEAQSVFGGGGEPSKADQEKFVSETVVPSIEGQIEDIRALGEPDEGAEELDTVLSDAEDALAEVEGDPSVITEGGEDPFEGINQQMTELGVPACAE
jgi:hypothetical protein